MAKRILELSVTRKASKEGEHNTWSQKAYLSEDILVKGADLLSFEDDETIGEAQVLSYDGHNLKVNWAGDIYNVSPSNGGVSTSWTRIFNPFADEDKIQLSMAFTTA